MIRLSLLFLCILAPISVHAASFDCSKALTLVEKAICSSPDLSMADDKLDQAYRAALTRVPEAATLVRESQRKWLQSLEQTCRRPAYEDYSFADCLAEQWENRIFFLPDISVRMGDVPFFFREVSLGKPCDVEPWPAGLTKYKRKIAGSDDADSHHDLCDIHATWPEAISNEPEWQAWNKALLGEARRFNASQDIEAKVPDHWVRFADPTWDSDDLEVNVNLDFASPTLVAATINRTYTYAHPAYQGRSFNWLLKQHRELKPDDLFRPNADWRDWIKKRAAQVVKDYEITALESDPSETEEIATKAADVAVQSRYWKIDAKGLSLIFTDDKFGYPTATTMPDVTFSWTELKPYLNPAFQIPR